MIRTKPLPTIWLRLRKLAGLMLVVVAFLLGGTPGVAGANVPPATPVAGQDTDAPGHDTEDEKSDTAGEYCPAPVHSVTPSPADRRAGHQVRAVPAPSTRARTAPPWSHVFLMSGSGLRLRC